MSKLKMKVLCISDLKDIDGMPMLVSGGVYEVANYRGTTWIQIEGEEESTPMWTKLENRHYIVYGKGVKRIGK